jgi:CBS domain containing-hemolysin-like protein
MSNAIPETKSERPGLFERLRALFGGSGASIRDDIEDALEDSSTQAEFTAEERLILKNALGLHDVRIRDIMVPRADIIAVGLDASLAEVLSLFRTAGHSRLPVVGEGLDDPRGMVHIRDFVDHLARLAETAQPATAPSGPSSLDGTAAVTRTDSGAPKPIGFDGIDLSLSLSQSDIVRSVLFVPPSMPALDLLMKMQAARTHMALVIDEYGGTDGLVSIEDIVEVIVGDIEDEHDEAEGPLIQKTVDGGFIADARASLEEVSTATGVDLSMLTDAEDVDTLGGMVMALAGHVPVRGEIVFAGEQLELEILDADPRRVRRIRLRPHRQTADPSAEQTPALASEIPTSAEKDDASPSS